MDGRLGGRGLSRMVSRSSAEHCKQLVSTAHFECLHLFLQTHTAPRIKAAVIVAARFWPYPLKDMSLILIIPIMFHGGAYVVGH